VSICPPPPPPPPMAPEGVRNERAGDGAERRARSPRSARVYRHRADGTVIAGEGELAGPNSKRVRLEKAGGRTKTYSQNEPLPTHRIFETIKSYTIPRPLPI